MLFRILQNYFFLTFWLRNVRYEEAAVIIWQLAETIDDEGLRGGFLTAVSVKGVLERWKNG